MAGPITPSTWIQEILNRLLTTIIWPILFTVSLLMFIYAGFQFLTAKGEPAKIASAQKAVIWACVGIAVAMAGFSATKIIQGILGV